MNAWGEKFIQAYRGMRAVQPCGPDGSRASLKFGVQSMITDSCYFFSLPRVSIWHDRVFFGPQHSCYKGSLLYMYLTHWGWVMHICVGNLTIIGSDNGLSPGRHQAITWTNVGILLIGPLGTNFSEMLIEIHTFSFKKIHLKMSSGNWRPFCLGLNVLTL